jgi:glycosyltransferase involved in cell wall biosynthesis
MQNQPLVSVITPAYNAEKYIESTINSVIQQKYKNWEMIIIDDCSKDNTYEIIKKCAREDSRIKIEKNERNLGVSDTRNKGINLAKGKYISFLDADDLWHKDKLEKQIKFMEKNNISLCYTGYIKINADGTIRGEIKVPEKLNYKELLKNCLIGFLTATYNRDSLREFYFKKTKAEDYIFWLEIMKKLDFAYGIPEPLAYYRVLDNSRSSNKIDIVKYHWKIYREVEKLNFFVALYYYFIYIKRGLKRYKI